MPSSPPWNRTNSSDLTLGSPCTRAMPWPTKFTTPYSRSAGAATHCDETSSTVASVSSRTACNVRRTLMFCSSSDQNFGAVLERFSQAVFQRVDVAFRIPADAASIAAQFDAPCHGRSALKLQAHGHFEAPFECRLNFASLLFGQIGGAQHGQLIAGQIAKRRNIHGI